MREPMPGLLRKPLTICAIALLGLGWPGAGAAPQAGIIVNGVMLEPQVRSTLENAYRTRLLPGRYWYDARSGLWGLEGGPSAGQIAAGLQLGAALRADASVGRHRGSTSVYVNGREIHAQELGYLQTLYGPVRRARYWLDPRGVGGYEGGPALFDLRAAALARSRQAGAGGYGRRGMFGNTGGDGQCSYYNDPSSGASVMTGC